MLSRLQGDVGLPGTPGGKGEKGDIGRRGKKVSCWCQWSGRQIKNITRKELVPEVCQGKVGCTDGFLFGKVVGLCQ